MHKFILKNKGRREVNIKEIEKIHAISNEDKRLFACFDSYFNINPERNTEYIEDSIYVEKIILQEEKDDFQLLLNFFEKDVLNIKLPKSFILGMMGYYEQTYNIRCLSMCLLIFKVYYPSEKLQSMTEFFRLQKGLDGMYGYLNPFIYEKVDIHEKESFKNFFTILAELCLEVERGESLWGNQNIS